MKKKPTVIIETGKTATALLGFPKNELPEIAKKTVKTKIKKK